MWSYLSLHTLLLYEKKTDKYNRFEEKYVTLQFVQSMRYTISVF